MKHKIHGAVLLCIGLLAFWGISKLESLEEYKQLNKLPNAIFENGEIEAKKHKVIILGISRDNIYALRNVTRHLENTGSKFADYRVVIYENNSTDGTKEFLKEWEVKNHKVTILSEDINPRKRSSILFLARARNKYIDYIADKFPDFDLLMVLDMDMHFGWDIRGIFDSLAKISQWDAVCANGIHEEGKTYDAFAFRNDEFPLGVEYKNYWTKTINEIQKVYPVGSPLVPVRSCFGAFALYKRDAIAGCRYDSVREDCEHVKFNECLKGKMFMNPSMVIRYS